MDLKLNFTPLEMVGFMSLKLPTEIFSDLKKQSFDLLNNNFVGASRHNEKLYGAIEEEYLLPDITSLNKLFNAIIPHYFKFFYTEPRPFKLESVWINYQKKYEHNAFHNHNGNLSFVTWIQIPYNLDDERKVKNVVNSNNFQIETAGFAFFHGTHDPTFAGVGLRVLQVDKSYEGKMIIFNSRLPHSVYPFYTSDDYRISIAGNLSIENDSAYESRQIVHHI